MTQTVRSDWCWNQCPSLPKCPKALHQNPNQLHFWAIPERKGGDLEQNPEGPQWPGVQWGEGGTQNRTLRDPSSEITRILPEPKFCLDGVLTESELEHVRFGPNNNLFLTSLSLILIRTSSGPQDDTGYQYSASLSRLHFRRALIYCICLFERDMHMSDRLKQNNQRLV